MLISEVREVDCWFEVFHGPYSFIKDGRVSSTWHGLLLVELEELLGRTLWTAFPPTIYYKRHQDKRKAVGGDSAAEPTSYHVTRIELSSDALPFDRWTLVEALLTITERPQWLNVMVSCMSSEGDFLAPYCLGDSETTAPIATASLDTHGGTETVWPECVIRMGKVYRCTSQLDKMPGSALPCDMNLLQKKLACLSESENSMNHGEASHQQTSALERSVPAALDPASLCGKMNGHHHLPIMVNRLVARLLTLCPQLGPAALASITSADKKAVDRRFVLTVNDEHVITQVLLPSAACGRLLNGGQHTSRLPFEYMMRNWGADQDGTRHLEMRQLGSRVSYGLQLLVSRFVEEDRRSCFAPLVRQLGMMESAAAQIHPAVIDTLEPFEVRLYNRICGSVLEIEDEQKIVDVIGRSIANVLAPYIWMSSHPAPETDPGSNRTIFVTGVLPSRNSIDDVLAQVAEGQREGVCPPTVPCRYSHCCGSRLLSEVDVGLDKGDVQQLLSQVAGDDEAQDMARMLGLDQIDCEDPEELARRLEAGMKLESDLFTGMDFEGDRPQRLKPEEEQELKDALKAMGLEGLLDDEDEEENEEDDGLEGEDDERAEDQFDSMFREQLTKLIVGDDKGDLDDMSALYQDDTFTKLFDGIKPAALLRSQLRSSS